MCAQRSRAISITQEREHSFFAFFVGRLEKDSRDLDSFFPVAEKSFFPESDGNHKKKQQKLNEEGSMRKERKKVMQIFTSS